MEQPRVRASSANWGSNALLDEQYTVTDCSL
jgi:hypothetical protein